MSMLFNKNNNNSAKQKLFLNEILSDLNIFTDKELNSENLSYFFKKLDDYDAFFSTQQIQNIDYSKFSNHVFFDSAINKLDFAFKKILDFKYDANEIDFLKYINSLDGYSSYILKNVYPKNISSIKFNGNSKIIVVDKQGAVLSDSKDKIEGILNPGLSDFSFSFHIKLFQNQINNQCLFKKVITNQQNLITDGFICYTSNIDNEYSYLNFAIISSISNNSLLFKTKIKNNINQHVCINIFNIKENNLEVEFLINNIKQVTLNNNINKLNYISSLFPESFLDKFVYFILGEGEVNFLNKQDNSQIQLNNCYHQLDDFIYEKSRLKQEDLVQRLSDNIHQDKYTTLYFKFNEPVGNYTNSQIVYDYSGNKLHGLLYYIDNDDFITDSTDIKDESLINLENINNNPVINGNYQEIYTKRNELLNSAKYFDENNSNLIFKLLPKHYFINQGVFENLPNYTNQTNFTQNNINSQNKLNDLANNHLVNIVLIWAKFFDELKLYIDSITSILDLDYDNLNKSDSTSLYLPLLCKMYGFKFTEIFNNNSYEKLENKNLLYENLFSKRSIRKIQNLLWKRILINSQDFIRSKGTKNSIKSIFNSLGIDSDKFIDIVETSSNSIITYNDNYNIVHKPLKSINFNQSIESEFNLNKNVINKPYILLKNLKTSQEKNGIDENWSFELFLKYKNILSSFNRFQSLLKFNLNNKCFLHLYFEKNNIDSNIGKLTLEYSPISINKNYNIKNTIENINIFDFDKYICISQKTDVLNKKLIINLTASNIANEIISKDIFISNDIEINNIPTYYFDRLTGLNKENVDILIGDYEYGFDNYINSDMDSTNNNFQGDFIKLRYWNKPLIDQEKLKHSENIENISENEFKIQKDNLIFDYILKDIDQTKLSNDEINQKVKIKFIDETNKNLNNLYCYHINDIIINELFNNITLNNKKFVNKIDQSNLRNRIKIISFSEQENKDLSNNYNKNPSHDIENTYENQLSDRLYVDMSITKSIDDDITKLLLNIESFNDKIDKNMSLYEQNYKELDILREQYFSKFPDDTLINYSSINDLFKFFDNIVNNILSDAISLNISNKGFNLVYESHILERHKYEYKNKFSHSNIHDQINIESTIDFNKIKKHYRNKSYNDIRKQ